jgi:cytoskeletal protein RodZ
VSAQYPPDEFDEIAKRGGPVGVHRAPRPWWSRLVAPVVVFLIAGAVAFIVATYLWKQEVNTPDEPTPTISETIQSTVTPSPDPTVTTSTSPTPTQSTAPAPVVQFDAKVAVLNGSGISGLAAKNQKVLETGGFSSVTAGNVSGSKPDANVVVYASDDLKATAEEVAKQLGIDAISLDVPQSGAKVEAILVTDPSK